MCYNNNLILTSNELNYFIIIITIISSSSSSSRRRCCVAVCCLLLLSWLCGWRRTSLEKSIPSILRWESSTEIPARLSMDGEKSTFVYGVSTILPCLILSGWLMMNGMPADDLYNTPLFLMPCTPNVSPWSAVKTMIVLSNVHVSSSSLRNFISFPTLRSISLTIPK